MFGTTTEVQAMARAMASHASARMGVVSRNVANADTPGYRAVDLASFARTYDSQPGIGLRATRPGHLNGAPSGGTPVPLQLAAGEMSPNGNLVSVEREMVRAAQARHQHDMALAITRSLGSVIRTSLGRR